MAYTVTFTAETLCDGAVRAIGSTLSVADATARTLVDLGVATASGLSPQTGSSAAQFSDTFAAKASNLSDLQSAVAGRTSLGLGTIAIENSSDYLTVSNAASTYQTALSEATTSVAGTIRLSQNTEVSSGTSTTTAVTPKNIMLASMYSEYRNGFAHNNTTSTVSGGAATTASGDTWGMRCNTGTAAGAAGAIKNGASTTFPNSLIAGAIGNIDFSKIVIFSATVGVNQFVVNSTIRGGFGVTPSHAGNVDIASKGFGWKCVGAGLLELIVHNGTTLFSVNTGYAPVGNLPFDLMIYSDGNGVVDMYINKNLVATSVNGPTGINSNTFNYYFVAANTDAALGTQTFHYLGNPKLYFGR